jgi:hypothetical protein
MSELSVVTFHTAPPAEPYHSYQKLPLYREVIGFSSQGSDLWTPRADEGYRSEEYRLDSAFAQTLRAFFEAWFDDRDLAFNCHMAAAGMRGLVNWSDEPTARQYALDVLGDRWLQPQGPLELGVGKQGVYAGSRLEHSVVGIGPDEHIQLNETNGQYASIVPAQYNHDYFGGEPGVNFYPS